VDNVARAFFELKLENAFLKKKGNEFQDFFSTIMEKRYPADFVRVRPWGRTGDRKNDGYLRSQRTLFQVYAPSELRASEAIAKIDEDFNGALPHWEEHFDKWVFVHNSQQGLGPDVTAKLLELDQQHELEVTSWGFEELRQEVFKLVHDDLASLFGPAPTRKDMVELGLEALAPILDQVAVMPVPPNPDLRPPPADKIMRSSLSEHVETLLKAGMIRVDLMKSYFRVQPSKQDEIAEAFKLRYEVVRSDGLAPDEIFAELQRHAGGEAIPSPARQSAVLAVLAFFFETCDIFEGESQTGVSS
jgi:hypothetical protein